MLPYDSPFMQNRQDRRAIEMERAHRSQVPTSPGQLTSTADPYGSTGSLKIDMAREPFCVYGRIVDAVAYCKAYRVQLERAGSVIIAVEGGHSSYEIIGAKQLNTYTPGTGVWVLWHPHMPHGVILCAMPDFSLDPRDGCSDRIVQGGRTGLAIDAVHNYVFQLNQDGGVIDSSAGRPTDSVHSGEWGAITETGMMVFLDPFMVGIRVDEETGVFGFYADQYLRVSGHNMEVRTAGCERVDHDDESEFNSVEGWTPYLWEARGAYRVAATLSRTETDTAAQLNPGNVAELEPANNDQQPFHRYREFRGYLGQGVKRSLSAPPSSAGSLHLYGNRDNYNGLAEETWAMDGAIGIRSAKELFLVKRLALPQPKRVRFDEDVNGDTSLNYKADGVYGSGPTHYVGDIPDPNGNSNLIRASAFMDEYAHTFNWKGAHPFYYHTRDWYIPDESAFTGSELPDFVTLTEQQFLPAPLPFKLQVDPRYGQVMYFPNDSFIGLLEDGGLVLGDGYGASETFTGGTIKRAAPGDIVDLPGRNYLNISGGFTSLKANKGAELIANNCDLTLKAESNLRLFGGNATCGGVLIQSNSPGISFKNVIESTPPASVCRQTGGPDTGVGCSSTGTYVGLAKDYYIISIVTGPEADGTNSTTPITATVLSASGTDDVSGTISISAGLNGIGTRGASATFSGSVVRGQEFTLAVSNDCNELNDINCGGILLRAANAGVVALGKEVVLTCPEPDGAIIINAQQGGSILTHSTTFTRHINGSAQDAFWTLDPPNVNILAEAVPTITDVSEYRGPESVTYTITVLFSSQKDPLTQDDTACYARLLVESSEADEEDQTVIPAPWATPTTIGRRGFKVTFPASVDPDNPGFNVGDIWEYNITQATTRCVNTFSCNDIFLDAKLRVNGDAFIDGCAMANDNLVAGGVVVATNYLMGDAQTSSSVEAAHIATDNRHNDLAAWAPLSFADLQSLQLGSDVLTMEFTFNSSVQDYTDPAWKLWEERWMQQARLGGGAGGIWSDNVVTGEAAFIDTHSTGFPGLWQNTLYPGFVTQDLTMFSVPTGVAADRGAVYESPNFAAPDYGGPISGTLLINPPS